VKGNGHEARCEVLARKEEIPGGGSGMPSFTYSGCSIIGAPDDLPEGMYTAAFDGHRFEVRRRNGFWLPQAGPTRDQELIQVPDSAPILPGRHRPI